MPDFRSTAYASRQQPTTSDIPIDRRRFLWNSGGGLGGIALAHLLGRSEALAGTSKPHDNLNGGLHHRAKAKRVIQLFMSGAASQCDTFDYKPLLIQKNGQPFDPGGKIELFQSEPGPVMQSPWEWAQHGESGKWVSSLLPHLAGCVDDIAFLPSMVSKSNVHGPATFMQNTGFVVPGFPSMGAWVSYGLGSMADSLPTFVVMPDKRGFAPNGPGNHSAGFLPASHQGTMIRVGRPNAIHDLFPPESANFITPSAEIDTLATLEKLNRAHLQRHPGDSRLEARIKSYEMAARLQVSAPEVLDISGETKATKKLYGLDKTATADFGLSCLVARRLLERGVRFVQLWSGADNGFPRRNWDSHEDIYKDHGGMALGMDQPTAALIKDLKSRGLLEDTIVYWTTEFGRMPCSQGTKGRDHNPFTFTSWLAGGGVRGGTTHGSSDEWSYQATEKPTYCYDVHSTILHLLGIDHRKLTFRHNGIDRRLTDVHGEIISEIVS
ncbi:MAG: sulfatase [Solibacterales bacterium]|nr:sulfatase [Bryobacterales bacterium]|tara:strand:+ start:2580 stop:4064 length:1485 start_codon:yes stop_codon:yes gene_type:complete